MYMHCDVAVSRFFQFFARFFVYLFRHAAAIRTQFSVSVSPFYIVLKCDKIIFNFDKNKSFVTKYGFENQDGDHGH